jgi:hypothetical protein
MKPIGSRDLFVRDDGPGAAAAPAGPELTARRARTGSAPACLIKGQPSQRGSGQ